MKCPNCRSQMFVTDKTASARSHVTFYRCSVCVSEHVSSEPVREADEHDSQMYFDASSANRQRYLMV